MLKVNCVYSREDQCVAFMVFTARPEAKLSSFLNLRSWKAFNPLSGHPRPNMRVAPGDKDFTCYSLSLSLRSCQGIWLISGQRGDSFDTGLWCQCLGRHVFCSAKVEFGGSSDKYTTHRFSVIARASVTLTVHLSCNQNIQSGRKCLRDCHWNEWNLRKLLKGEQVLPLRPSLIRVSWSCCRVWSCSRTWTWTWSCSRTPGPGAGAGAGAGVDSGIGKHS